MNIKLAALLACSLCAQWFSAPPALAHAVGTSYITIDAKDTAKAITRVDLTLRDLEFAVGLDDDADGRITWREVLDKAAAVAAYIDSRLNISRGGKRCALDSPDVAIDRHADEVYAALSFATHCAAPGVFRVRSDLMFALDDTHRTLLTVSDGASAVSVLTANTRAWTQTRSAAGAWNAFARFIAQGIWHIWIGFDHLAFLMLLLLPLSRTALPRGGVKQILKVVTAFTAAHSITLACAALGFVNLPSRWTEAAIAATIVVAALVNLCADFSQRAERFGIVMAFGFGLIHGLGFASALADLTTNNTERVLPLIGFNIGVEIGQLAVVALVFPILFLRSASPVFRQRTVTVGSATMGLMGVAWLVQRTIFT